MKFRKLIATMCLMLLIPAAALPTFSTASAYGDMTPETRKLFDKGLAAAEQAEWVLAADNFSKAWKIHLKENVFPQKYEPLIVFNWGLAESKITGRELRATACLNYYLAIAKPDEPNIEAVRKEITGLEVRNESRMRQLLAQAKKFATQLQGSKELQRQIVETGGNRNATIEMLRRLALRKVVLAQARAGDFVGARQTAAQARVPSDFGSHGFIPSINGEFEHGGIDELLKEKIASLETRASSPLPRDYNLRELLASDNFNKEVLTDPAEAFRRLTVKANPDELFDPYMKLIDDMLFVFRRAGGRQGVNAAD